MLKCYNAVVLQTIRKTSFAGILNTKADLVLFLKWD